MATINSFAQVSSTEAQLEAAVSLGPVAVAIEADQPAFQQYKSGVFSATCGTKLDHGVLVVGYTATTWIVKNSWGPSWGEQGAPKKHNQKKKKRKERRKREGGVSERSLHFPLSLPAESKRV